MYSGIVVVGSGGRDGRRGLSQAGARPPLGCLSPALRARRSLRACVRAGTRRRPSSGKRSRSPPNRLRTSCSGPSCGRRGTSADAIRHLEEALTLQPDSEEAVFQLGLCHLEKNRLKRALECFHEALEKNPRRLEYQEAVRVLERRKLYPLPDVEGPGADAYRRAEESARRADRSAARTTFTVRRSPRSRATRRSEFPSRSSRPRSASGRRRSSRAAKCSPVSRRRSWRPRRARSFPRRSARRGGRTRRRRSSVSSWTGTTRRRPAPSGTTSSRRTSRSPETTSTPRSTTRAARSRRPRKS